MKQIKEVRFYLEVDLYEKIVKLAEKDNRDFSNMVETVLKRWVEREESFWLFGVNNPAPPGPRPIMHPGPVGPSYPKTSPVDPPITVCEGMTVGPNGAMFASTDNPNGTCVTNGEEVGDRGVEVVMNNGFEKDFDDFGF